MTQCLRDSAWKAQADTNQGAALRMQSVTWLRSECCLQMTDLALIAVRIPSITIYGCGRCSELLHIMSQIAL